MCDKVDYCYKKTTTRSGYCRRHGQHMRRYGKIIDRPIDFIEGEYWASIKNHPTYKISSKGRVFSTLKHILLKTSISSGNRYTVKIGSAYTITVGNEMAKVFLENTLHECRVNYIDGNSLNLDISNIEYPMQKRKDNFLNLINNSDDVYAIAIRELLIIDNNNKMNKLLFDKYDYFKKVVVYLLRKFNYRNINEDIIMDCVQDGFLKVIKSIRRYQLRDIKNIEGFISTIIRNETINYINLLNKTTSIDLYNDDGDNLNFMDTQAYSDMEGSTHYYDDGYAGINNF